MDLQGILQGIIQFHDRCLIATTVTVVGGAEYCHNIAIMTPVVTLKHLQF